MGKLPTTFTSLDLTGFEIEKTNYREVTSSMVETTCAVLQKNRVGIVVRSVHAGLKHIYGIGGSAETVCALLKEWRAENLSSLKQGKNDKDFVSAILESSDDGLLEETDIPEEYLTVSRHFDLPSIEAISELVDKLVGLKLKVSPDGREQLLKALTGLTRCRIARVLAKCLARSGKVDESAIGVIIEEKRQTIRETGILEFIPVQTGLDSVGGLENLKAWVKLRSHSFTDAARDYGLPSPKGVLLAGIQGTGKSLSAKTIAAEWKLPLLRLDVGRLFGGIVGESESRVRQVIKLAEAIAPVVLMIDEIEKSFSNNQSDGDSGTSRRVFATLLTWLAEKTSPVFVVATANNVELLPAELIRKGRLDELFFLSLPTQSEREQIFKVHLNRLRPNNQFNLELLAARSQEFSGAEIEQVIYDAMQFGFSQNREFTTDDILDSIVDCIPLAKIANHQIEALKDWASRSGAKSASLVDSANNNLLPLLEVDYQDELTNN
ncbi:AAA family ATPase [Planktothrix agardhii]|uniref:Uncharacterized AAA domain-containing protein ycf46 n=1 Tax=Planktothrix agardhii (strain NIVA-CYA 126/8) TaxID=388467 RepID=A0A073CAM7_PLAA1|nr:AAA family ATPase [Planktothrix agardhii]KEI65171.1 putative ATPase [Planktothrix agardhii NIVA-CYA 126/8]CAD5984949.1 putative AAA domain-containing protein ycf46 [Planktothrix agardhii]